MPDSKTKEGNKKKKKKNQLDEVLEELEGYDQGVPKEDLMSVGE